MSNPVVINNDLICEELRSKFECHTVILYGSRARGDFRTTSDYDVLGVRNSGEIARDARLWNGVFLDAFIYPEEKLANPDESMLYMRGGMVLIQKEDLGTRFLARLDELFKTGPKKLSSDEIHARKVWAHKMLARAKDGDIEGNFRRAWLLTALLEDYFQTRGEWYRGPKESLSCLKARDPSLFQIYNEALVPAAPIAVLEKLINTLHGNIQL